MREETNINREILYSVLLERLSERYVCLELHDNDGVFHLYEYDNPAPIARVVVYSLVSGYRLQVTGTL